MKGEKAKSIPLEHIENWLINQIGQVLNQKPEHIDPNKSLYTFGFDSLHIQELFAEIQKVFLIKLDDYFTLDEENIKETAVIIQELIKTQQVSPILETPHIKKKESKIIKLTVAHEHATDLNHYKPYLEFKKTKENLPNIFLINKKQHPQTLVLSMGTR